MVDETGEAPEPIATSEDEDEFITSIVQAKKPRLSPFWSRTISWLILLTALLLVAAIYFGFVFCRTSLYPHR